MSLAVPPVVPAPLSEPWVFLTTDPERARVGVPIGSAYVEDYWTPIIGPSSVALLRLIARTSDHWSGTGSRVAVADLAARLGLGSGVAKASPMVRTMDRLCMFGLARWHIHDLDRALEVHTHALPLSPTKLRRLPDDLQAAHSAALAAERAEATR